MQSETVWTSEMEDLWSDLLFLRGSRVGAEATRERLARAELRWRSRYHRAVAAWAAAGVAALSLLHLALAGVVLGGGGLLVVWTMLGRQEARRSRVRLTHQWQQVAREEQELDALLQELRRSAEREARSRAWQGPRTRAVLAALELCPPEGLPALLTSSCEVLREALACDPSLGATLCNLPGLVRGGSPQRFARAAGALMPILAASSRPDLAYLAWLGGHYPVRGHGAGHLYQVVLQAALEPEQSASSALVLAVLRVLRHPDRNNLALYAAGAYLVQALAEHPPDPVLNPESPLLAALSLQAPPFGPRRLAQEAALQQMHTDLGLPLALLEAARACLGEAHPAEEGMLAARPFLGHLAGLDCPSSVLLRGSLLQAGSPTEQAGACRALIPQLLTLEASPNFQSRAVA